MPLTRKQCALLDALYGLHREHPDLDQFGPTKIAENVDGWFRTWRGARKLTSSWACPTLKTLCDMGLVVSDGNGHYALIPHLAFVIAYYRD